LIAIPYKIWRNFLNEIHDVIIKMAGKVQVARPDSPGYDLENFFKATIKNIQPVSQETSEQTSMECGIENLQAKSMLGKPRMRMS
jgi:hypothetical protein